MCLKFEVWRVVKGDRTMMDDLSSYSEAGDNHWESESDETSPPPSVGSVNSTSKKTINRGRWTKDEVNESTCLIELSFYIDCLT